MFISVAAYLHGHKKRHESKKPKCRLICASRYRVSACHILTNRNTLEPEHKRKFREHEAKRDATHTTLGLGLDRVSATYGKHRARGLRQDLGRGAGQMRDQPQIALHWAHAEHDQVCCPTLRGFEDTLCW